MKIKITRIGTIDKDGITRDWTFDGTGQGSQTEAINIDGNTIGGYTVRELMKISQLHQDLQQLTSGDA